jgi:ferredoxin-NADP reductase/predicted pyridoxine 5'-phosphate oxidase superfamily flavin-nucleotide-binding protein
MSAMMDQAISSAEQLRAFYEPPNAIVLDKVITTFDKHTSAFVQASTFLAAHIGDDAGGPVPLIAGGPAGFARIIDPVTIEIDIASDCWPDSRLPFSKNSLYSVGLLFVLPGVKESLRMKGAASVEWSPDDSSALRLTLRIDNSFFQCGKAFIRSKVWEPPKALTRWKGFRTFKCIRKEQESAVITSFYFAPADGGALPQFNPGQHIQVQMTCPGDDAPVRRAYSLSGRPGDDLIRLTVKRERPPAVASNFLHDYVDVGSLLEMRSPSGRFVLNENSERPIVLLSAGVGLTPMLSMLEHLVAGATKRQVWYFHGASSGREHAMNARVRKIEREHSNVHVHVCYSRPRPEDMRGADFNSEGRLSIGLLKSVLPWDDYEFYICGPGPFMKAMAEGLMANGIRSDRVLWETFSSEKIDIARPEDIAPHGGEGVVRLPVVADVTSEIEFVKSGMTVSWTDGCRSLLDLAEAHGVPVRSSCRTGDCFSCAVPILSGDVHYVRDLEETPDEGTVLLCSAVPRGRITLDI